MRVSVFIVVCLLGAGCGSSEESAIPVEEQSGGAATVSTQSDHQVVWRDEGRGFTVTHPESWRRAPSPLTPHLSDPRELLALGTYELRPGGDRCAHQPVNAVEDLGPKDALLVIFERAEPFNASGYPPREGRPQLAEGTNRFCVSGRGRSDSWFSFGESGRAFYGLIAIGNEASEETRAELFAIYESIRIETR